MYIRNVKASKGFANFYHYFIRRFSNVVCPMIATIKKITMFYWTPKCQKSFKLVKKSFTTTMVLAHFNFEKECILETDLSENFFVKILFWYREDGLYHLVAFFSCKHLPQKINYEIYNKELLAIVKFFKE